MTLSAGDRLRAVQGVGGATSEESDEYEVQGDVGLVPPPPRILEPVLAGERRVWLSGVSHGSQVAIFDGDGNPLGEGVAAETIGRVSLWRNIELGARLVSRARRCVEVASPDIAVFDAVMADERIEVVEHRFGETNPHLLGDFDTWKGQELLGKVYFRLSPAPAQGAPLVVVMHGQTPVNSMQIRLSETSPCTTFDVGFVQVGPASAISFRGCDTICRNLARHGMVAVSLALDGAMAVVTDTLATPRVDFLEAAIDAIRAIPRCWILLSRRIFSAVPLWAL